MTKVLPLTLTLLAIAGPPLQAHAASCQATGAVVATTLKGVRYDGPTGIAHKIKCKMGVDAMNRFAVTELDYFGPDSAIICSDPTTQAQIVADINQLLQPLYIIPGTSVAVMNGATPKAACASAFALTSTGGSIQYASEMKTTDPSTVTPKSEKGPLGYALPDGTIFIGAMQLKY